jgi:dipeptide/tripeptide permease
MDVAIWAYMGKVLFWWGICIVKFLGAAPAMVATSGEDWTFLEVFGITSSGAALGVFIFYHFGDRIFGYIDRQRKKQPRVFNKKNRLIARLKVKYGLKGLLLVCGLISVPIAALLAARYFKSDTTLPLVIMGFTLWSLVLTAGSFFFENIILHLF